MATVIPPRGGHDLAVRAAKLRKGDTVITECGDDLRAEAVRTSRMPPTVALRTV